MVASTIEKEDSDKSISDPSVLDMDTLHTHRLKTLLIFSYLLHAQLVLDRPDKHWPGDIEIEIPFVVLKPFLLIWLWTEGKIFVPRSVCVCLLFLPMFQLECPCRHL